jgi:hypothetical protein
LIPVFRFAVGAIARWFGERPQKEFFMSNRLQMLAIAAAVAVGASTTALAQGYTLTCPAGYVLQGNMCYSTATPGGIVGGALNAAGQIVGGAVNTAGEIAGGAVNTAGQIVGGAVNGAGQIVGGTVGAVTSPPPGYGSSMPPGAVATCPPGYMLYGGLCYPAH